MLLTNKLPYYSLKNRCNVYQPSDDTFLFMDALEILFQEQFFNDILNILEIGSGTGILSSLLLLNIEKICVTAIDIYDKACETTSETLKKSRKPFNIINYDKIDCFKKDAFDLIIFNPVS